MGAARPYALTCPAIHHTPKHASWLNMVEIEIASCATSASTAARRRICRQQGRGSGGTDQGCMCHRLSGGTEVTPGVAPSAAPVAAAAPAPARTGFFGRRTAAPPSVNPNPSSANQFAAANQAQGRCPGAVVVWVNTQSGIYHFAGTKSYGNTKQGAYMCEAEATAAGDRASRRRSTHEAST